MISVVSGENLLPRSGRVTYSSLSVHIVFTGIKLFFFMNSSETSENTESCAAAWSALILKAVIVLYLAPALPDPNLAGVLAFISK